MVFGSGKPFNGIKFIENKGQWESNILFRAELPSGALFIENQALTYVFHDKEAIHLLQHGHSINKISKHAIKVNFLNSQKPRQVIKDIQAKEYYNYFIGNNKTKWATNVKAYSRIELRHIYKNISLELIAHESGLKMNFWVEPNADISQIKLGYEGASKLILNNNGELEIVNTITNIIEKTPESFQTINNIQYVLPTKFVLNQNIITYSVENYNPKHWLIIDPNIVFGTYIGSAADNFGFAGAFDSLGNAYGAGTVYASNFVATAGAFDVTYNGGNSSSDFARDAFLAKFSPDGKQLLWCTFLGGSHNEQPHSVIVNNLNEVLVFGTTNSTNFPVSDNGFQKTNRGQTDIFISKFNDAGNTLLAGTYFGGSNIDGINGASTSLYNSDAFPLAYNYADYYRGEILTDRFNNVYIATCTQSRPQENLTLVNSAQPTFGGGFQDGLLLRFNSQLSNLQFSTYLGGSLHDAIYSIVIDNANNLIVCGGTNSNNLLAATGFGYKGGIDGFVAKYSNSGSFQKLIYTGTSGYDQNFFVQTDFQGNIFILGQTTGNYLPTPGTFSQTNGKQFLIKYDNNLNGVLAQTVFGQGGSQPELVPSAFLVDECGRIYISGWGGAVNMSYNGLLNNIYNLPTTANAFQRTTDGSDFYLLVLMPDFKGVLYGTYYGGATSHEHVDGGTSHFDKRGIVYQTVCAGCGGYSDFPTTQGAHSRTNPGKRPNNPLQGGCNLAMFKFDLRAYLNPPEVSDTIITLIAGDKLNYRFRTTDKDNDILNFYFFSPVFAQNPNFKVKDTVKVSGESLATLEWQTNCNDVDKDTIVIDVEVEDQSCPTNNISKATIKIVVIALPEPAPYPDCLKTVGTNEVEIQWKENTTNNFGGYLIFRQVNNTNFELIDSINNKNTKKYYDIYAFNHHYVNHCYRIVSLNICKKPSDSSRTICSVVQFDTINNPGFTNINDTLYIVKPFDRLNALYMFKNQDNKDSVFLNVTTSHPQRIIYNKLLGNDFAACSFNFEPNCNDVEKDTIYIYFTVNNNQCPVGRYKTKKVKIWVEPLPITPAPKLYCPRIIDDNTIQLFWDSVKSNPYSNRLLLFRTNNNQNRLIGTTKDFDIKTITDNDARDLKNNNYCYYLVTTDICDRYGDTSKKVCLNDNAPNNFNVQFFNATVVDNKAVQINWFSAPADSFWKYEIYKSIGRNESFTKLTEITNIFDTSFTDENVKVNTTSYCYKIVNYNVCGVPNLQGKKTCSIVLKGSIDPFVNYIDWLSYDFWEAGVKKYEILKTEPGYYKNNIFNQYNEKVLSAIDNNLNYDNGLYEYTVIAYENAGGKNGFSQSNTIELVQPPVVYAPNAFTPNSDGLNETYKTSHAFVKDFNLQIYNRWGERIFETNNKYEDFKGWFKQKQATSDVYFYIINYTGFDNSVYTKKGNITLLR